MCAKLAVSRAVQWALCALLVGSDAALRRGDLYFHRLLNLLVPVKQQLLDRAKEKEHRQDQEGGEYRRHVEAEADGHPDRRHDPDRCRCREAVDLVALPQDRARAKEADPGDDLRGNSCRVGGAAEQLEPESRKQAGADPDEPQGFDAGRMAVKLALEADRDRKDGGDQQAEGEIDVVEEWQLLSLYPACRVGPCRRAAPQGTLEGPAGRGCSQSL